MCFRASRLRLLPSPLHGGGGGISTSAPIAFGGESFRATARLRGGNANIFACVAKIFFKLPKFSAPKNPAILGWRRSSFGASVAVSLGASLIMHSALCIMH